MAESVFNGLVRQEGLADQIESDSAGTSDYHIGELPDPRTMEIVNKYGLVSNHRGQQFNVSDFTDFNYIVAMDGKNLANIKLLLPSGDGKDQVFLMRNFDDQGQGEDVPDPYWSGVDGFENVYQLLLRSCKNFLTFLKEKHPSLKPQ